MFPTNRLRPWLVTVAALALAVPASAADADKYLPDDTEVVLTVNVKQILESELVKKHALGPIQGLLRTNNDLQKALSSLGFDPLKDVNSVTIAAPGLSEDIKPLIVVHGKVDKDKFEAQADALAKGKGDAIKVHQVEGAKVYELKNGDQPEPIFASIANATTVVASPKKSEVLDALARGSGKKKSALKKEIQGLLESADTKQSLYALIPGSALAKATADLNDDQAKKTLGKIQSIQFGLTVDKDLKVDIALAAKDAAAAKELAGDLSEKLEQAKGLVGLIAGQDPRLEPALDLVNSLKTAAEGSKVTIKGGLSTAAIEKALKKGQ